MTTHPIIYIIIAFGGVALTLWGNNRLQKKLITIKNKEKVIDLLLDYLKDFTSLCTDYWKVERHNKDCALNVKLKYAEFNSLMVFACKKYSLSNKQNNDLFSLSLELFLKSTGGDFDSKKRNYVDIDRIHKISKLSNKMVLELLKNKI